MSNYLELLKDPRWQKKSGIYKLIINGCLYVGSAVNITKRLISHVNHLKRGTHCNIHLQRAFNKYKSIDFEVIELVENVSDLISREQYYIDLLYPRYNIAPKAGSMLGFKHSKESRKKISTIQKGKKMSDESRARMSVARLGKKLSLEHRHRISKSKKGVNNPFYKAGSNHPQFGIKRSVSTIEKLSGLNNPQSKRGVLYDVQTGGNHIFFCLKSLCTRLNLVYRGVLSAQRAHRFYKDRFYIDFVPSIPNRPQHG